MKFKRLISFILFLFVFLVSTAQENERTVLLKTIFQSISNQHNVQINYIEEEIAVFKIIPPNSDFNLKEKLNYISIKTKLKFEFITETYINVINDKKLDKPLCGYLIDSENGQPLPSAIIKIEQTNFLTISNEEGYFEINNKSEQPITIQLLGYKNVIVPSEELYKEFCPKIKLEKDLFIIEELQTQTFLTKGVSKKDFGIYEISPKKFGILPGLTEPDVFQTMQQIPGIISADESITNINVRGGTHDQNKFTWNGIRLFQTGHFFGLISALNPNLANKIKITKNANSSFNSEGVSSQVEVSTQDNWSLKNQTTIGANLVSLDFSTFLKTSKSSNLEISARRSITDFFESPTYKSYYNKVFQNSFINDLNNNTAQSITSKDKFYFYDVSGQFQQQIGLKNKLYIDFLHISNHFDLEQNTTENSIKISKSSFLKQESLGGSISLTSNWNNFHKTDLNLYLSHYNLSSKNETITSTQVFTQQNEILDTGINFKHNFLINSLWNFNFGYQINEIGILNHDIVTSPDFSRKIKDVLISHALIAETLYLSKNNKFKSKLGIRQNYIQQLNTYLTEPKISITYVLSSLFNVEINAEQAHQTTSQIIDLQQDFLGIEKRRWILSNNEDIPIIKSKQLAVNFKFSNEKKWLVTLEGFYKIVDGITTMSQGFQNQFEFSKTTGKYQSKGAEILIQKQVKKWTSWMSYTYSLNDYTFSNLNPSSFPNNFDIRHNLGSALIYDFQKIKIAIGCRWFTGKPITHPLNNNPIFINPSTAIIEFKNPNSDRLESYFQVNLSGSYSVIKTDKSKLIIGFSILNLFDKQTLFNQFYRINSLNNTIELKNTYNLERTPNIFLRYQF